MKYFRITNFLLRNRFPFNRSFGILRTTSSINFLNTSLVTKHINTVNNRRLLHTDSESEEEESYEDLSFPEIEIGRTENERNILFKNYQDDIIDELNSCASIEQLLNLVLKYKNLYEDKHIVQTVLILADLQKMCYRYSFSGNMSNLFLENIQKSEGFGVLLGCIKDNLDKFNPEYLGYVLLYLNKLGISVEDQLMQNISLTIRDHLLEHFYLGQCSRFLTVVFTENSVRPYYLSLPIIPLVIGRLDKCESVEDLCHITVCLNKLNKIVTSELLLKYNTIVRKYMNNNKLTGNDYETILKIILLLNYPQWRDKCVLLISDCILLIKNDLNLLNAENLSVLYEVFFKNQEPGGALNSIQRCSAKFLHQLDENELMDDITKLKLFSCLIYFSSPTHRVHFQKNVANYLKNCHNYKALVELRKIFSYVKISDPKLCTDYWNLSVKMLNDNINTNTILKLCQNYINFNTSVNNFRHYNFEAKVMNHIKDSLSGDLFFYPAKISGYLNFTILYGKGADILELLLDKFEEILSRVKASDCLKISHSLFLLNNQKRRYVSQKQLQRMKTLLNKCTTNILEIDENNYMQNSMLLKAFILRNDFDNEEVEKLLFKYKDLNCMSSKIIENVTYVFLSTQSLIPEVINKCTEYVTKHENNILGFNAEKLLFLCFSLDYYPINADKFFQVATDVIIRDQERLSGLAFLQAALSLCYFNKLPSSFVKQIFNVEFLEKLDVELENCYAKEKYPQRVRKVLMMLNRAVCLEYPEYNVPWFHKKYIEGSQIKSAKDADSRFQPRLKEYLIQVLGSQEYLLENVITPYGYHIDFVVNFNRRRETVASDSSDIKRRVALLLLRKHAFTRFYTRLKGKYRLKMRHLEILGYDVVVVNFEEWINLLYGEERIEYLSNLIWPSDGGNTGDESRR